MSSFRSDMTCFLADLTKGDRVHFRALVENVGAEYPFWFRNGQSVGQAVDEYIGWTAVFPNDIIKVIRGKGRPQILGGVALVGLSEEGQAELGFFIHKEFRGQGLATNAVFSLLDVALHMHKLQTLTASAYEDKLASHAILKKVGCKVIAECPGDFPDELGQYGRPWTLYVAEKPDIARAITNYTQRHQLMRVDFCS